MKAYQAGGVTHKKVKAPMVDPKGAFTKVQDRTLASAKTAKKGACLGCGGKMKSSKKK